MKSFLPEKSPAMSDSDFRTLMRAEAARVRSVGDNYNAELEAKRSGKRPLNERGGRFNFAVDLANAAFPAGPVPYEGAGWGVVYSLQGSTPGGVLNIDFDNGGKETLLQPGAVLMGPFSRFNIFRDSTSITSGTALLRVLTEPDALYAELAKGIGAGVLGNPGGTGIGPAGATVQVYNSAAGNIPTAATDGLSLAGVTGMRAQVVADAGTVMAGGTLVWWQYDSVLGVWGETDMVDIWAGSGTARRIWFPVDKQVWVPEGRIYPELRSATSTAASANFKVRLYTWGG